MAEPTLSASEQHKRVNAKLTQIAKTLQAVENRGGLSPELTDTLIDCQAAHAALQERIGALIRDVRLPETEARTKLKQAEQDAKRTPQDGNLQKAVDAARNEVVGRTDQVQQQLSKPEPRIDEIAEQCDDLLTQSAELLREATSGLSLAEQGQEAIDVNRKEFESALDHHRQQAFWMLVAMLLLGVVATVLLWLFFVKGIQAVSEKHDWLDIVLVLGGRVSLVALVGSALVFLGKLHSRHSQQAVIYQDRLAGLDFAMPLMEHGRAEIREEAMRTMAKTYLSLDRNAFDVSADPMEVSTKDLQKLIKAVEPLLPKISSGSAGKS